MIAILAISANATFLFSAWIPFLHPLPIDRYWMILIVPLLLSITVVWKVIKLDNLQKIWQEVASLTGQFIALMVIAAAFLWLITTLF